MNKLFLFFLLFSLQSFCETSWMKQFQQVGYVELCDQNHTATTFDNLYASFDIMVNFLQTNKYWNHKLYLAKERFIRSKDRNFYSTDFFGLYDESGQKARAQIAFYYAPHFHEFVLTHYPEIQKIPEVVQFLEQCFQIQKSYEDLYYQAAEALQIESIFDTCNFIPILFKVVKYLPTYAPDRPHYDGTAFSLFLDSTDYQSLLLSSYKAFFTVDDFSVPLRIFSRNDYQNSVLLIPGAFLTEFDMYPTPHIVMQSGKTRYAIIAFVMRPNYVFSKNNFSDLPNFKS